MPYALKKIDLKKYDLIISCESGPSKGIIKNKKSYHVCYCHSPMRYLYDMRHEYLNKYNFLLKKIKNKYFKDKGNIENLYFAYKIAKNFKIKDKTIIKAINAFEGLPHRQEIFFSNKDLICVNDSKATSFDATAQALSKFSKIYWIVGGLPKYKDHFNLKYFKNKIVKAYIIGSKTSFFQKMIKNKISYTVSGNLKNAVNTIHKDINHGNFSRSTILLSPAAASFDQFSNFEDRGFYFKKLIKQKFKKN